MKITTSWNFGNFTVAAACILDGMSDSDVSNSGKALLEMGLLQALQRVPSSNAEKHVVGATWPKNKKGEPERPKDFKRNSIPFSEETAMELAEGFGTSVKIGEGLDLPFTITNVAENEGSEAGTSRKMATEMWGKVQGKFAMYAGLGLDSDPAKAPTDAEGIEACHKFLASLRKAK